MLNKDNQQLREMITLFLTENFGIIQQKFKTMKLRDQVRVYCCLLKYGLPVLRSVKGGIDFSQLTETQLDKIIDELRKTVIHESEPEKEN